MAIPLSQVEWLLSSDIQAPAFGTQFAVSHVSSVLARWSQTGWQNVALDSCPDRPGSRPRPLLWKRFTRRRRRAGGPRAGRRPRVPLVLLQHHNPDCWRLVRIRPPPGTGGGGGADAERGHRHSLVLPGLRPRCDRAGVPTLPGGEPVPPRFRGKRQQPTTDPQARLGLGSALQSSIPYNHLDSITSLREADHVPCLWVAQARQ